MGAWAQPRVVVAAALVRGGRLLVARRAGPPELAGRWELPGGKVEPGEGEPAALVRECAEELGADVTVGERVAPDLPIERLGAVLRVYRVDLLRGRPRPLEHLELRWARAEELERLDWVPSNRPLLGHLRALLRPSPGAAAGERP